MPSLSIQTHSVEETLALGERIGRLAPAGSVTCIALDGLLGAGKTHLTRGIALGAGVADPDIVSSPTYVLLNIYDGPKPVYHLDAYRVESPEAFEELGFDEFAGECSQGGRIVVIEWASRVAALLPEGTLHIQIAHDEDTQSRTLQLAASGGAGQTILAGLAGG